MKLISLTSDAITAICSFLSPIDLISLACASKQLALLCSQDSLWEVHCRDWLGEQCSTELVGVSATDLQGKLRISSQKALYKLLHSLGAWPSGLWYASGQSTFQPHGQLLSIVLNNSIFEAKLINAVPVFGPLINQKEEWQSEMWFTWSLPGQQDIEQEEQDDVYIRWSSSVDDMKRLGVAVSSLFVFEGSPSLFQDKQVAAGKLHARLSGTQCAQFARLHVPSFNNISEVNSWRAPTSESAMEEDSTCMLRHLQGVYTACYGPHGLEIVRLSMAGPQDNPPPGCPITALRLEATKITGDPNVPALQCSFVVDAAQGSLGPYSLEDDDPFPQPNGMARPVLSYYQSSAVLLDFESRPVFARFKAWGQINRTAGIWRPEFIPATFVIYRQPFVPPNSNAPVTFTVILEDEGVDVRHGVDFKPFSCPFPG